EELPIGISQGRQVGIDVGEERIALGLEFGKEPRLLAHAREQRLQVSQTSQILLRPFDLSPLLLPTDEGFPLLTLKSATLVQVSYQGSSLGLDLASSRLFGALPVGGRL